MLLMALGVLCVIMPYTIWHETWFGRRLSNQEIERYLQDDQHPRKIQQALSQLADRMVQGDAAVKPWYPQIAALARYPNAVIRNGAAWAMGQDTSSSTFHRTLLDLLADPDLMVRRNAALSLVRFADASARAELVKILQPLPVPSPEGGVVSIPVKVGQRVGSGTMVARLRLDQGQEIGVRSPLSGRIDRILPGEGLRVTAGDPLVSISPESDQVWEALRGLYYVGQPEDLPLVERYGRPARDISDLIRRQAVMTAAAIRTRSERNPSR